MKVVIDANSVAIGLSVSDSSEQAAFLNRLSMHLKGVCKDGSISTQLCYIADELNEYGDELILGLAEFIRLRKQND